MTIKPLLFTQTMRRFAKPQYPLTKVKKKPPRIMDLLVSNQSSGYLIKIHTSETTYSLIEIIQICVMRSWNIIEREGI